MAKVGPSPAERVRGEHPTEEAWRADALAGSRHTRWLDELREPLDDQSSERAVALCAQVSRAALLDFAPALILLSASERRRAQALAAHTLLLFDFASQSGLEGERLAHLNRVEYDLEMALDGHPRGQPVFVALALSHRESPWPPEAFDRIGACARQRISQPRPATDRDAADEALQLAGALTRALSGEEPPELVTLVAATLRIHTLAGLGEATRRRRLRLSLEALPDDWLSKTGKGPQLAETIRQECESLRELLAEGRTAGLAVAPTVKRAARYLELSSRRLLARTEALGYDLVDGRPTLGALTRLGLLLRARIGI